MAIIGIDLGTTNSLAAYWRDGEVCLLQDEGGRVLFPSVVSYVKDEGLLVGWPARERLLTHGEETVGSFKRFMGTDKKYSLGGKMYTPMELSAMVLERIRKNAEYALKEEIEEAIITVPAYFNDKQRSDTKKAAEIAGLHVERLINEPSSAALAYRLEHGEEDRTLLVFDFGGGTLDLSYVECFDNIIEIVAVAGDNYLGGDDIDRSIADYFCRENGLVWEELPPQEKAALKEGAERAKIRLETEAEVTLELGMDGAQYRVILGQDILFEICIPLFEKIKKIFIRLLHDANSRVSDVDDLVMVGGSSRLAIVQRFLTELLGKEPVVLGETDKVVAMGAGVYSGIRSRNEDIRDMMMTDVCPFTLGVESWRKNTHEQGYLLPMIERNSTLPSMHCQRLYTLSDYQREIVVRIYQGEEYYARDNLYLGEVRIPVKPAPAGQEGIDVYFSYDINGILFVEVVNSQKVRNHILLANQSLSEAELERYKKQMEELMIPPIQRAENQELLARLFACFEGSLGQRRYQIGFWIDRFTEGLQSGRKRVEKQVVEETEKFLARLEMLKDSEEDLLFDGELKYSGEYDDSEEDEYLYEDIEYDSEDEQGGGETDE